MDVLPPVAGAPTEVAAWAAADAAADVATNAATNGATNAAPEPERLHSTLWRASQLGRPRQAVFASGFAALDAVLPGGGWPAGVLTELLLPHPGVGEMRLMAPVLARLQQSLHERCVMWFDPPAQPCAWALGALGLVARQMVLVRSAAALPGAPGGKGRRARDPSSQHSPQHSSQHSSLWALEHALKSGHVGAVLAWLPARLPADALRRLQLAAQAHEGPAFVLRGDEAVRQASPAPLRLVLSAAAPDWLRVQVLKRRGPPLAQPLLLELPPVLAAPAAGRARAGSVVPGARAGAMGAAEVMAAPLMAADAAAAQAALPPWPSLNTPGAL